jgi:hypothetical protein
LATQIFNNMKFFKIVILLLLIASPYNLQAQKEKSVTDTIIDTKTVLPKIKLNTDSIIEKLNKDNNNLKDKERDLKISISDKDQIIKSRDAEIQLLTNRLIFADTVIARISNDCLRKKYDPVRVDEALVYFRKMYSQELQSKFSPLEKLMKQYSNYSKEIADILAEAENDPEIKNPFTGQKKALSYIGKIESTLYYKEVYNANWTISYLNNVIHRVIKVIKAYDPKVSKEIKLLDKMN